MKKIILIILSLGLSLTVSAKSYKSESESVTKRKMHKFVLKEYKHELRMNEGEIDNSRRVIGNHKKMIRHDEMRVEFNKSSIRMLQFYTSRINYDRDFSSDLEQLKEENIFLKNRIIKLRNKIEKKRNLIKSAKEESKELESKIIRINMLAIDASGIK